VGDHLSKFGFLGGSFDPIHFGHLNLAIQMLEKRKLDKIFFCPAFRSPHKESTVALPQDRLAMVKLAIAPIPQFELLDWEAIKVEPSYTIDTIRALAKSRPDALIHLILGDDQLPGLDQWKEIDTLLRMAPPYIGTRHSASLPPQLKEGFTPIPIMEISSTQLRERLSKRKYCGHLVPAKVLDYIEAKNLYL